MGAGQSMQLRATVAPADTSPNRVWWSSSDPSVVRVNDNGVIRAMGNGRATITARTWNNRTATVNVRVRPFHYVRDVGLRFSGRLTPRTQTTGIVLHHTVGDIDIHQTHRIHQGVGMYGIAYHFLIDREGRVWQGRPMNMGGGHVRGNLNMTTVGIAWRGNFQNERMTPAARAAGEQLIRDLLRTYPSIRWIHGHGSLRTHIDSNQTATACPGRNFPTQHFRNLLR